jgi:hypothetical protein
MIEEDDGFFTWNYRIVNTKSQNGGADWYCLQEVCYNSKGQPTGYGDPCTGSDDVDSMTELRSMILQAFDNPPLQEEDFKGDTE